MINKKICKWIDYKFYRDFKSRWDDNIFRGKVLEYLKSEYFMLDLGAGDGSNPYVNFKGLVKKVVGIDPEPSVFNNPFLDEAKIGVGERIPYPNESFDLVICVNTLEHISEPCRVFKEVNRVLKPKGMFLVKTTNKYHYISLMGRITPFKFHLLWNKLRGVEETEVFPKYYRANDVKTLKILAEKAGFRVTSIELYEGRPEYLRIFFPLYILGFFYERMVNKFKALNNLRSVIIAIFQKS